MKKIVTIFSYHLYHQRRRGSMHWICDSLRKTGWHVRFVTCDFSWITKLKGDRRTAFGEIQGVNKLTKIDDSLSVAVIYTPWHPVGRSDSLTGRLANLLTSTYPWLGTDKIREFAANTDLVIVESCGGLMMVDSIKQVSNAPVIYRVSDNLHVVRPVKALLDAEKKAIQTVDAVSMASEHLARFLNVQGNLRLDPMGLDKKQFDRATTSPYSADGRVKVVISGSSGLDCQALQFAAKSHPDWDFIQFGTASDLPKLANIIEMGERPFSELVPWVKFANIGFAPYITKPGFEYQAEHSNRLLQYIYSSLPCIVPTELAGKNKPHFIGYQSGSYESISNALDLAACFDRRLVPKDSVLDWDQLATRLTTVTKRKTD